MNASTFIAARVSHDTKDRFAAAARAQGISGSVLLKRLVDVALASTPVSDSQPIEPVAPVGAAGRISVRLCQEDQLLLRERARARHMPSSTYVSFLVRAHLRSLAPLPSAELTVLRAAVAELSAFGRNIKKIARAANSGQLFELPGRGDLEFFLTLCEKLRDSFKAFVSRNRESWSTGHEKADR